MKLFQNCLEYWFWKVVCVWKFFKPWTKKLITRAQLKNISNDWFYKPTKSYNATKNCWIVLKSEIDNCQKMNYLKHSKEEFDGRICSAFCIKFNLQIFCQIKNIKMCKKSGTCKLFLSITKLSLVSFDKKLGKYNETYQELHCGVCFRMILILD